jgi:hypothetical protein
MSRPTTILDPGAPVAAALATPASALRDVRGKTIGFIDNTKPNFNLLADEIGDLLVREHGAAGVVRHRKRAPSVSATDAMFDDVSARCDLVITGSGD